LTEEADLDRDQAVALAVARLIAADRTGVEVEIRAVPERADRTNPAVELITADAVGTPAIEHTLISTRPDPGLQGPPLHETLPTMLAGRLPPGDGSTSASTCVVNEVNHAGDALARSQNGLARSILEDGRPGIGGRHMAKGVPPDTPFPITLARWPRHVDDVLPEVSIGWWRPPDLEERRRERLVVALSKKLPKITAAEAEGHQGVLVLESDDIQLSNSIDIRAALLAAAAEVEDPLPSWIVCWEQVGGSAYVSTLRSYGEWIGDPRSSVLPAVPHRR
jgi:hypothetical protein